jgi:hypothetical protein
MSKKPLWKCPKYDREFANPNQWHLCIKYDLNNYFKNKREQCEKII